jgi:hypothetical protein
MIDALKEERIVNDNVAEAVEDFSEYRRIKI